MQLILILSLIRTYELLTPVLIISDPDLIGKVMIKDFSKFSDHRVSFSVIFLIKLNKTK